MEISILGYVYFQVTILLSNSMRTIFKFVRKQGEWELVADQLFRCDTSSKILESSRNKLKVEGKSKIEKLNLFSCNIVNKRDKGTSLLGSFSSKHSVVEKKDYSQIPKTPFSSDFLYTDLNGTANGTRTVRNLGYMSLRHQSND